MGFKFHGKCLKLQTPKKKLFQIYIQSFTSGNTVILGNKNKMFKK